MNEDYYKQQAARVRSIASLADPFTKRRLLALAEQYDAAKPSPRRSVPIRQPVDNSSQPGQSEVSARVDSFEHAHLTGNTFRGLEEWQRRYDLTGRSDQVNKAATIRLSGGDTRRSLFSGLPGQRLSSSLRRGSCPLSVR